MRKFIGTVATIAVTGFVFGMAKEAAKKPGEMLGQRIQDWMAEDR